MSKDTGTTDRPRRSAEANLRRGPVTLREIARLAGVHPSTVSLAMRNNRSISPAMRKRIQTIARKAGYHRDPLLDAFNARRVSAVERRGHPVIPFVAEFASQSKLMESRPYRALWEGAARAAESMHYRLEFFPLGAANMSAQRLDSILLARGIECLIAGSLPDEVLSGLNWGRYCAVNVGEFDPEHPRYAVAIDVRQGARLALKTVWKRGWRRIGLLLLRSREGTHNDLLAAGYFIEQRQLAADLRIPPLLINGSADARAVRSWVRRHQIDAVLSDFIPTEGAARESRRLPGTDVPWAALDADTPAEVAGIVLPHDRVGALAVELVVNLTRTNQQGIPRTGSVTLVPVSWREGRSLPARRPV